MRSSLNKNNATLKFQHSSRFRGEYERLVITKTAGINRPNTQLAVVETMAMQGGKMCWLCYRVRPYDGPSDVKIPSDFGCGYLVGNILYTPREEGWKKSFTEFPSFESEAF